MASCDFKSEEAVKKAKSAEFVEAVRASYRSEEDQAIIRAHPQFMRELHIFGAHDRAVLWRMCSPKESLRMDLSAAWTVEDKEHILDLIEQQREESRTLSPMSATFLFNASNLE
jgi:hypothetical protein